MGTYVEHYWTYEGEGSEVEHPPQSWPGVLIPWSHGWDFEGQVMPEPLQWALSEQCAGKFCVGNAEHRMIGLAGIETDEEMHDRIHTPTHVLFAFSNPRSAVEFRMRFG